MFYLFLAEGFEEIEALATVDILRRANVPVLTVGVTGETVEGSHGICVVPDIQMNQVEPDKMEGIILPGGLPGTLHLQKDDRLSSLLDFAAENQLWMFAICAAPLILGEKGFLSEKKATCYPGFEKHLHGAILGNGVCRDGKIITAQGAGFALPFAYAILDAIGIDSSSLKKDMLYE